jgi:hypothetical protein
MLNVAKTLLESVLTARDVPAMSEREPISKGRFGYDSHTFEAECIS